MNIEARAKTQTSKADYRADGVRIDFVPAKHYISPDFLDQERKHLWHNVWQVACREEELPHTGSTVTYDIMDESIAVVRKSGGEIRAYYNVCPHRGRRLVSGGGQIKQFQCRFHGWRFDLDGNATEVLDRADWQGCPDFSDEDLRLTSVKVDTWGGWVFVNPDPDAPPLGEFLDPVNHVLGPYRLEDLRYRWSASVKVPCNWKVGLEAFNEGYHLAATHPQLLVNMGDDVIRSRTFGRHGNFYYPPNPEFPIGTPSPRLGRPAPSDLRQPIVDYFEIYNRTLRAVFTDRGVQATHRIVEELPPEASAGEILAKVMEVQRDAALATGAGWPDLTPEQMFAAGSDWHVFPNLIIIPGPDGALCYRVRPHPTDPDHCLFEVSSLARYAPGAEPPFERTVFDGDDDWKRFKDVSIILQQDFDNMEEVQHGMKSKGFRGARPNPLQEATVSNFHRALVEFIEQHAERAAR